jgi:ABC-type transport system substrate-binding protein
MTRKLFSILGLFLTLTLCASACGAAPISIQVEDARTVTAVAWTRTPTITATPSATATATALPTITATPTVIPTITPTKVTTRVPVQPTATAAASFPRAQTIYLLGSESSNPRTYDPATTSSSGDKLIFSGLVALDPALQVIPDLAESWQTADGKTYVFKLRRNARFHNGRPVIAQDFIYSWERAANPKTQSDTVLTYLGDIVGVKEMRAGKADRIAGLKALDDYTLQVTIDAPKPYFLLKLTYPTAAVLDRENIESGPDWYRAPNGTGPYRQVRWERMKQIVYERNTDFYREPPTIPFVVTNLYSGTGIRLFETGAIDLTSVSRSDVARVLDPKDPLNPNVVSSVNMCTSYITFDVKQPPFDDVKVRQAFAHAFDRQKFLDVVLLGVGVPAKGVYPPTLPGFNRDSQGLAYDPERARKLLAESKYGSAAKLAPIIWTTSGGAGNVSSAVAAPIQMWQQTLGVKITVENVESDKYYDELGAGRHGQIVSDGWCADYPDPENFADVLFHSTAEHNRGHYYNPQVDTLLEQARVETDPAKRIRLYQQIEPMIVNDAPAVFTYHSISYVLVKPHIQGYVLSPISIPLIYYLRIDASKIK